MTPENKFYNELVLILKTESLSDALGWMAFHGQSLILNYGEENQLWECSWITGGKRFTAFHVTPLKALKNILNNVRTEILMRDIECTK